MGKHITALELLTSCLNLVTEPGIMLPRHYYVYTQYITIQISSPGYAASAAWKAARCGYM